MMKKIIFMLVVFGFIIYPHSSFAATSALNFTTDPVQINVYSYCDFADQNLYIGLTDSTTNGKVSELQTYLIEKNYLVMPVGVSKGYFGPLTQAALGKFQAASNITPAVGYFGPITRGYIQASCTTPGPEPIPVATSTPIISSISPTSGLAGANVTLTGSGFSSTGNTVHFDIGVVPNISSADGKTLTFQIPNVIQPACTLIKEMPCLLAIRQTTQGTYNISVYNADNLSSNTVTFEVTGNPIGI